MNTWHAFIRQHMHSHLINNAKINKQFANINLCHPLATQWDFTDEEVESWEAMCLDQVTYRSSTSVS